MREWIKSTLIIILCCTGLLHAQPFSVVVQVFTHDGKPLKENLVTLTRNTIESSEQIPGNKVNNTTWHFSIDSPGVYLLRLTGTHHRACAGPLLVENDSLIELEVRLGTLARELATPDSVFITGSFNNFSLEDHTHKMTRQKNGTYSIKLPVGTRPILYRPHLFVKGDGIPVDAPGETQFMYDSNRYTYWGSGNYYAVNTNSAKSIKLTFDPETLLTSDLPAVVKFAKPYSDAAKLLTSYLHADFRIMKFRLASYNFLETRQLGDNDDFLRSYNVDKDVSYFAAMAREATNETERGIYNLASFHFIPTDTSRALSLLPSLSPDNIVWRVGYHWTRFHLNALADRRRAAALAEQIAARQNDPALQAGYLSFALETYFQEDQNHFVRLYNHMMKVFQNYPDFLESMQRRNPIRRDVALGKPMPDFSFVSMDDSLQVIGPSALKGKTYLIDLWATWCVPCIAEMKTLHHAYEKFNSKGFTILSISFDDKPQAVARFRRNKWTMPWHHAFVGNDKEVWKQMENIFELQGLPRAILVNSSGIIVGIDEQIKGENLDALLSELLEP